MSEFSLRYLVKDDVQKALACERKAHETIDPDFGVPVWPRYIWDEDDFLDAVRQYRSATKKTNDTRMWAVEKMTVYEQKGGKKKREEIRLPEEYVGTLALEYQDDGYEILLFSASSDEVRKAMMDFIQVKVDRQGTRKRLSAYIPDGDWATLKFLMNNGFRPKLKPNPSPTGFDVWFCEKGAPKEAAAPGNGSESGGALAAR